MLHAKVLFTLDGILLVKISMKVRAAPREMSYTSSTQIA